MNQAVITQLNNTSFLLIYEEGELAECHPLSCDGNFQIGNIYIGRVEKVVKNIQSAFIRLDEDHVGYLPLNDMPAVMLNRALPKGLPSIAENDLILVQVEQEPQKMKQARVTGNISIGGKYVALGLRQGEIGVSKKIRDKKRSQELKNLPIREGELSGIEFPNMNFITGLEGETALIPGCVFRTACETAENDTIVSEYKALYMEMKELLNRAFYERHTGCIREEKAEYLAILEDYGLNRIDEVKTDIPEVAEVLKTAFSNVIFYEDESYPLNKLLSLETEIKKLLNKKVWLKSGGFLIIEPTEAMVVIDVNSGKSIGKKKMERHIFEMNMEAAREITRQLRLRNLSGIIMIDFINMESEEYKKQLVECIEQGLRKDKVPGYFIEITKLDVFELTRKKVRRPVYEVLREIKHE